MLISIITTVYNNSSTLKDAIESVICQDYPEIEYIIIDGGSTDNTISIIKSYGDKISQFISEPDSGIYDGLNKGLHLANGKVIGFLHSDDLYPSSNTISTVMSQFSNDIDGVYGDLIYTSSKDTNRIIRYWQSSPFKTELLYQGWMPAHPTLFLKKSVYEQYGQFDLNFKIAADYDFMLRILQQGIHVIYLSQILYVMRIGGASNKSIQNILQKTKEDFHAIKKNRIGGMKTLILKNISKLKQFFIIK